MQQSSATEAPKQEVEKGEKHEGSETEPVDAHPGLVAAGSHS